MFCNNKVRFINALLVFCVFGSINTAMADYSSENDNSFQFALIGDVPYAVEDEWKFENLINKINDAEDVAWVLHAGDIKSGSSLCSDELLKDRFDSFARFKRPFIYIPGDNEWTDCHRIKAGEYSPLERLAKIRQIFFPRPGYTLGQEEMVVETQATDTRFAEFPENVRWQKENVTFATMHIVGSENATQDFPGRNAEDDQEAERRTQAAIHWLNETLQMAKKNSSPGVFIMIHGNPNFEEPANSEGRKGFNEFLNALEKAVIEYGNPVVLAHGDTHYFRVDKPLKSQISGRRIENLTRLETFGSKDVHWVMVTVEPESKQVFKIQQKIIKDNVEQHSLP